MKKRRIRKNRSSKNKQIIKRYFTVLFLIISLLLFSIFIHWHFFQNNSFWKVAQSVNILVKGDKDVQIFKIDFSNNSLFALHLPSNTKIESIGNKYFLAKQLANKNNSTPRSQFLIAKRLFAVSSGIIIDAWIDDPRLNIQLSPHAQLRNALLAVITARALSDISKPSAFYLSAKLILTKFSSINFYDLTERNLIIQEKQEDNTSIFVLQKHKFSQFVKKTLIDQDISNEALEVLIVNASSKSGLAARTAQSLENRGYRIIKIENGKPQRKSQVLISRPSLEHSASVVKLNKLIPGKIGEFKERFDVKLILGQNFLP